MAALLAWQHGGGVSCATLSDFVCFFVRLRLAAEAIVVVELPQVPEDDPHKC